MSLSCVEDAAAELEGCTRGHHRNFKQRRAKRVVWGGGSEWVGGKVSLCVCVPVCVSSKGVLGTGSRVRGDGGGGGSCGAGDPEQSEAAGLFGVPSQPLVAYILEGPPATRHATQARPAHRVLWFPPTPLPARYHPHTHTFLST